MSDERIVDDELLRRLDCAWSEQCGPCLNVVNAEVPKLLDDNAALQSQLAAALARAEALDGGIRYAQEWLRVGANLMREQGLVLSAEECDQARATLVRAALAASGEGE